MKEIIQEKRMKARELLEKGGMTHLQIAVEVGCGLSLVAEEKKKLKNESK